MSNLCSLVISPLRCLWFSLCILFLWVVAPTTHVELSGLEYPEDCWDRQSRSMCETNRANNNRTFCTTQSGFKDTSTRLRCLNCREEELWGATNPERRYFRKQVGRFRGSKVWSHLQVFSLWDCVTLGTNVSPSEVHPLLFWLMNCNNDKKQMNYINKSLKNDPSTMNSAVFSAFS